MHTIYLIEMKINWVDEVIQASLTGMKADAMVFHLLYTYFCFDIIYYKILISIEIN